MADERLDLIHNGERVVPELDRDSHVFVEHLARYRFARDFVGAKSVLDVACGSGYGSRELAGSAKSVIGVDYAEAAVAYARETYGGEDARFLCADAANLPFEDAVFDVVVSFETIEHLVGRERFLDEVRRVLVPGGLLLLSTPDRGVYPAGNPYHYYEYTAAELRLALRARFKNVRVLPQDNLLISALRSDGAAQGERRPVVAALAAPVHQGIYLLAMCSDDELPLTPGQISLDDAGAGDSIWDLRGAGFRAPSREIESLQRDLALARIQTEDLRGETERLEDSLSAAQARLRAHEEALGQMTEAFHRIESSLTYRFTTRLRALVDAIAPPGTLRGNLAAGVERAVRLLAVFGPRAFLWHSLKVWVWLPKLVRGEEAATAVRRPSQGVFANVRTGLKAAMARAGAVRSAAGWGGLAAHAFRPHIWLPKLAGSLRSPAGARGRVNQAKRPFGLPARTSPRASIIVPVHNQSIYTYNCIKAIAENTLGVDYEVIVVDDASTDDTSEVLRIIENVRTLPLATNRGFIGACNAGAAIAEGEYLVFLNNDTQVREGWLAALVATLDRDPAAGVVGAKLVYPDGRLQEAGVMVTRDGWAWNYGRMDNPDLPPYNYLREVDYCSGAALAVRRSVFEAAGGFDASYAPAYYEDVELAFTVRRLGYKVLYQPEAVVVHFEGVSHGTDTAHGLRRYQEINRLKFVEKWRDTLEAEQRPSVPDVSGLYRQPDDFSRARERGVIGRAFVSDYMIPTFDRDAGSQRMQRLILMLRELGYAVTFLPADRVRREPYASMFQQAGVEVLYEIDNLEDYLSKIGRFDFALVSRPDSAEKLLPFLARRTLAPTIFYDTVDLHFLREARRAEVEGSAHAAKAAERYQLIEMDLIAKCDATIVVTEDEKRRVEELAPGAKVYVLPTIHNVRFDTPGFGDREGLLFVGNFHHHPNSDAVRYFVEKVFPLVLRELPGVVLTVAGTSPGPEVERLAGRNVRVTGWVADIEALLDRARVFVAPVRYGAGISGKVGESMGAGLPAVTTSLIAGGMGLRDGVETLVGDTAEEFARKTVALYRDEAMWRDIAGASLRFAHKHLSHERVLSDLAAMLAETSPPERVGAGPTGAAG